MYCIITSPITVVTVSTIILCIQKNLKYMGSFVTCHFHFRKRSALALWQRHLCGVCAPPPVFGVYVCVRVSESALPNRFSTFVPVSTRRGVRHGGGCGGPKLEPELELKRESRPELRFEFRREPGGGAPASGGGGSG